MKINNIVPIYTAAQFDTSSCIDSKHKRGSYSPISTFTEESIRLRKYVDPSTFDNRLSNYIFLGQMSAAESYFRAIIRSTILVDSISEANVASKQITYAAAKYLDKSMIPEALLENLSFSSINNIEKALREYLKVKENFPEGLKNALSEFDKVCQLRHCIVHRFAYLGSTNAANLGIESHGNLIEKPIKFSYSSLQSAFQVIDICVKTFNNFLFTYLIYRLAENNFILWNYRDDRILFEKFYTLFVDSTNKNCLPKYLSYQTLKRNKK